MSTFNDPQVGDLVAVHSYSIKDREPTPRVITRVTQTQIEIDGVKYLRSTGYRVGASQYNRERAEPWTAKVEAAIETRRVEAARAEAQRASWVALRASLTPLEIVGGTTRRAGNARVLTIEQCAQVDALASFVRERVAEIVGVDP